MLNNAINVLKKLIVLERKPHPKLMGTPLGFEFQTYVDAHRDLSALRSEKAAARHFYDHGALEGRLYNRAGISDFISNLEERYGRLPDTFLWKDDLANYPDLSHLVSSYQAAEHYLKHGRSEGRIPFRFDTELYRSLYFAGQSVPDEALLEHFTTVGSEIRAFTTLEQVGKSEGLEKTLWLQALKVDEFYLLNGAWAGPITNKLEALRAMVREGFDRLAPISLTHEFEPHYYVEANPGLSGLTAADLYRHWLFHGLEGQRPGNAPDHLSRHGLKLAEFPGGFDWERYQYLPGVHGDSRWAFLDHVVANNEIPAADIPVQGAAAAEFLAALATTITDRVARRAIGLFEVAGKLGTLSPDDHERWGDALGQDGSWVKASDQFDRAIALGSLQVPMIVKAAKAAEMIKEYRKAIDILTLGKAASGGDFRWRSAVQDAIEALFRDSWVAAEKLYSAGQRADADAAMTAAVSDVARYWTMLDPIGIPVPPEPRRRVVMLANVDLRQCTHYRVEQKVEMFRTAGINLEVYTQAEVSAFLTSLAGASAAIFYRLPAMPMNVRAITVARALGIPSYYDIDDLIFDPTHYPEPIETYGASVSRSFYNSLQMGVPLFRAAMALCDYGIASTTLLAEYIKKVVRTGHCFVLPNGIDSRNVDYFDFSVPRVRRTDEVVLFYGSGTKAHNSDFLDLLGEPLLTLMMRYPNLRLMVIGFLSLDAQFEPVRDRIVQFGWTKDVESYWSLLAEADINMAVLIPSPTTDCKSEIKWLEAATMGVPSVVSATHRYLEVLDPGVDALVAQTSSEWLIALDALIKSSDYRRSIADAARQKALSLYSLKSNADRLETLLAPAFAQTDLRELKKDRKKRILFFNIFFPPQTVGGSTRVARDNIDSFLASEFANECDFAVMTSDNDNPDPYQLRVDDYKGLPVFRASTKQESEMEWRPFNASFGDLFARVLELWKPDLVHIHSIQRGSASIIVECIKSGVPYINTIHDAWWLSDYQFLTDQSGRSRNPEEPLPLDPPYGKSVGESLERRRRLRLLLERSAAILCVSNAFTRIMHEAGYPTTLSIPNGVSPLKPFVRTRSATGRVRVVQVSGWTHHKGYHLIQAAFKQGRFNNIDLTILDHHRFGGPEYKTLWGETSVRIIGKTKQEEMQSLYGAQDVLLAPSVWPETFGLVAREAIQAGLWVVASDRGAIGEEIEHNVNGWVIDVSTIAPLLSVIQEINDNPERYLSSPPKSATPLRKADDQARDLVALYQDILEPIRK
ncbi:glycosyltransferase, partial [Lichenihabitans psoromatis]|uniref:glycosyltransferase n=1 Tax=Lichenihabitans psoromatis TaxID=2528642 RepID=UPI0010383124